MTAAELPPPLVAICREPPIAELSYTTLARPLGPASLNAVGRLLVGATLRADVADGLTRVMFGSVAGYALVPDVEADDLAGQLRLLLSENARLPG